MGPDSLYCGKWRKYLNECVNLRKISKSCCDLDLGPAMPNIEIVRVILIYYNVFKFHIPIDQFLFELSRKNTETRTHTYGRTQRL